MPRLPDRNMCGKKHEESTLRSFELNTQSMVVYERVFMCVYGAAKLVSVLMLAKHFEPPYRYHER